MYLIDIIFLALLTIFLVLRFRSILGNKNEDEETIDSKKTFNKPIFKKLEKAVVIDADNSIENENDINELLKKSLKNKQIINKFNELSSIYKKFDPEEFIYCTAWSFKKIINSISDQESLNKIKFLLSNYVYEKITKDIDNLNDKKQLRIKKNY